MNRAFIWALGVVLSLVAHAILFSFISLSVETDPVQNQPVPTSQLDVQAYEVERTKAKESALEAQAVTTEAGKRTALSQRAIPQSHSKGENPKMQALAASSPSAVALQSSAPGAAILGAEALASSKLVAQLPETADLRPLATLASAVAALDQAAALLRPEPPASPRVATQPPESTKLQLLATLEPAAAVLNPAEVRLTSERPFAQIFQAVAYRTEDSPLLDTNKAATALLPAFGNQDKVKEIRPSTQALAQADRDTDRVASLVLPAQKATATLAFSGDDRRAINAVSLAAIQSFMQAGDLRTSASAAGTVRDAISELLSQVPCARLQVSFVPETGTLQVNGHIPESGLRLPVLAALQAQVGPDIGLADKLLILPRPQCGALAGIVAVGLAQSTDQITNPLLIGEGTHAREFHYAAGDRLILDLAAPDYDAFIYVDYFDAAGQVIHLSPNEIVPLESFAATKVLQIGADKINGQSLNITIGPPYGQEIAVAFATSVPLYDGVRPMTEPALPYLDWMKTRVAKARETHPDFKGEWVYFFVTTRSL